tara:strand:- start:253 stop:1329 length:1077 start_codon:yes stop_codon:yes gene_type:complete
MDINEVKRKIELQRLVDKMKLNMMKHRIRYDNYISESINILIEYDNYNNYNMLDLLYYIFTDIKIELLDQLAIDIMYLVDIDAPDKFFIEYLYNWYNNLNDTSKIKLSLSYTDYINTKVNETIGDLNVDFLRGKYFLDIGSGDCALTFPIAEKLGMKGVAVDIETEIEWKGDSKDDRCKVRILYDGTNLNDILNEIKQLNPYNEKNPNNIEIGLITYNHSLHHFGSYGNIKHSIEQASNTITDNGYIIFREHAVDDFEDDIKINLQHILFQIKYIMNDAETFDEFWNLYIKFIDEYTADYMSEELLKKYCRDEGLTFLKDNPRIIPEPTNLEELINKHVDYSVDESLTLLYIFQKKLI